MQGQLNMTVCPVGALQGAQVRYLRRLRQLHVRRIPGSARLSRDRRLHVRGVGRRLREARRLLLTPS